MVYANKIGNVVSLYHHVDSKHSQHISSLLKRLFRVFNITCSIQGCEGVGVSIRIKDITSFLRRVSSLLKGLVR